MDGIEGSKRVAPAALLKADLAATDQESSARWMWTLGFYAGCISFLALPQGLAVSVSLVQALAWGNKLPQDN